MHPYPDHVVLWVFFVLVLGVMGIGAWVVRWWYRRMEHAPPVRVAEPPKPSERTDIISKLPLVFGKPIRHRYDPEEFESTLNCITCKQSILPQAEFWEIPILNDERPDEAMLAVCLQCDSRSPYDKLEES